MHNRIFIVVRTSWKLSDTGTLTILWSQPISALQILSQDGTWRWIKHIDNALVRPACFLLLKVLTLCICQVVNVGDALEMLSGGFYKGTIHRVVQPPADQRGIPRLGAFYFALADDDVRLAPLMQSPVLQRSEVKRRCADEVAPTMEEWRKARTRVYGQTVPSKDTNGVDEEEIVKGVAVKYYN